MVGRISQDQMPQLDFNTGAAPFTDNDIHAQIVPWQWLMIGGFFIRGKLGKDVYTPFWGAVVVVLA